MRPTADAEPAEGSARARPGAEQVVADAAGPAMEHAQADAAQNTRQQPSSTGRIPPPTTGT
ncbi:hypothetical protein [Kitasatospora sp. NPDC098663]|uniref:hypothetical protein n=1 Tax=Kitasatospora sp. NPDC098663 TaxID=3364096 RepID=UPI0037F23A33